MIAMLAPPLARVGQSFGAPEYFALMVLGLIAAVVLAHGSVVKAIAMIVLGLLLGLVGTDGQTAAQRFTFDLTKLSDGIEFAVLAIGVFGVGEIIANLTRGGESRTLLAKGITQLMPTRDEIKLAWPAALRGTALGALLGVLPGGGATLSSFAAYVLEKKVARDPSRFGHGAIEGVAGPEAANNAGAQTSFIPMLTLGLPGNAVMALMIGAMMIHGIQPGPQVMTERPALFWGMVASMWIGNLMLLVINLPLIGIWVQLLKVPYRFLYLAVSAVLRNRRLHHLEQRLRGDPRRPVRRVRLHLHPARLRAGADDPRLRARAADGRQPAARHAHLRRRSHDLCPAADRVRAADRGRDPAGDRRAAVDPQRPPARLPGKLTGTLPSERPAHDPAVKEPLAIFGPAGAQMLTSRQRCVV